VRILNARSVQVLRNGMMLFGVLLVTGAMLGLIDYGWSWLVVLDLAAGCASLAVVVVPDGPGTTLALSPFLLAAVLTLLAIAGMLGRAEPSLTRWTLAFGIAYALLGGVAAALSVSRYQRGRASR
jgi:hypothetical protein